MGGSHGSSTGQVGIVPRSIVPVTLVAAPAELGLAAAGFIEGTVPQAVDASASNVHATTARLMQAILRGEQTKGAGTPPAPFGSSRAGSLGVEEVHHLRDECRLV